MNGLLYFQIRLKSASGIARSGSCGEDSIDAIVWTSAPHSFASRTIGWTDERLGYIQGTLQHLVVHRASLGVWISGEDGLQANDQGDSRSAALDR